MKVLISPGYGAGWSTWNQHELAIDARIIKKFEEGATWEELSDYCQELGYDQPYMGGFETLTVVEVPRGVVFRIYEYDGAESIEYFDPCKDWIVSV